MKYILNQKKPDAVKKTVHRVHWLLGLNTLTELANTLLGVVKHNIKFNSHTRIFMRN